MYVYVCMYVGAVTARSGSVDQGAQGHRVTKKGSTMKNISVNTKPTHTRNAMEYSNVIICVRYCPIGGVGCGGQLGPEESVGAGAGRREGPG